MTGEAVPAHLSVLVVDDDESLRESLRVSLELQDYQVTCARSATEALDVLKTRGFSIILSDLRMPGADGMAFISACHQQHNQPTIVLMSAFGDSRLALEAIKLGAYDYISKPFTMDELIFCLRKIEEREQLRRENASLKADVDRVFNFGAIVSQSEAFSEIFETVKRLATFSTTVLITGESGTGKELVARAIHQNSLRASGPFVAINCGAIPETLIESELFGHKKGAFTDASRDKKGLFEEAHGGTLFLDEIGELPLHLQVKLLRALQERKIRRVGDEQLIDVDVRVIAATLRNLEEDAAQGRFRDDLLYRLNVVSLHVPPLRDRPEDIPLLADHFIKKYNRKLGLAIEGIDPDALKHLLRYSWKGNVRELENCIERAMVLSDSPRLGDESLPAHIRNATPAPPSASSSGRSEGAAAEPRADENLSIKERSRALEIELIRKALVKTKGNRTHAAKILQISHRALLYKLKEYHLGGE